LKHTLGFHADFASQAIRKSGVLTLFWRWMVHYLPLIECD